MRRLLICLMILCGINRCPAQINLQYNFKFKNYSTADGLNDNIVIKTVTDKYGFLWIATHNGISRFDGLSFKTYTYYPGDTTSLRSIWVSDLLIDNQQVLWASTELGLCYYDETKDRFFYVNDKAEMQLVFKMPLAKGRGNIIWIAAEDGLRLVNTITKKYRSTALKRIPDPQFVMVTDPDHLIIGTRGKGIFRYNISSDTYHLIALPSLPADMHCMDAWQDEDGVWIATSEGLLLLKPDNSYSLYNEGIARLEHGRINQLMCISTFESAFGKDNFVCGTYNRRLFLFDKKLQKFTYQWQSNPVSPNGFLAAVVYNFNRQHNMLWIGTDKGLFQINLNDQQQQTFFITSLINQNEQSLVKKALSDGPGTSGLVWIIPWEPCNGIVLYNLNEKKVVKKWNTVSDRRHEKYTDIAKCVVSNTIAAARDSAIDFFNTDEGLVKTIAIKGNVVCIKEDKSGIIWAGLEDGICRINPLTGQAQNYHAQFTAHDLEQDAFGGAFRVWDIDIASNGLLWLAVKYGLFSFDTITKRFTPHRQFEAERFSVFNRCSAVKIGSKDSVWVGDMAGLSCFIPSQNKFVNYNTVNGLKSTYIYSLVQDLKGLIWGRGNADIFCFNPLTKSVTASKLNQQYDVSSYLQRLSIENNNILLGHEGGFTIFNSIDFVKLPAEKPLLFINTCKVNNRVVTFNHDSVSWQPLQLPYFENQLYFEINAIDFNFPQDIEYHYRLQGLNEEWTNALSKNDVSFNNLSFGKYRFAIYAVNKHNNTQSATAYFAFEIAPAWWQHWWLIPLLALLFSITVIITAKQRIKSVRKKEEQKTAVNKMMAELETKLLRSQMNPHFIFNSLNSIQKYIWENKEEEAAEYLASFAKLMRSILENSGEDFILLEQEMQVMKLYVELEHRRSNSGFDYSINTDANLLKSSVLIPPMIMQPFIENAIWHGLNKRVDKGNLLIEVFEKDGKLVCIIDDDGVGIKENKETGTEEKSLGIAITRQRIKKLIETTGASASVEIIDKKINTTGMGTKVIITLPYQTT